MKNILIIAGIIIVVGGGYYIMKNKAVAPTQPEPQVPVVTPTPAPMPMPTPKPNPSPVVPPQILPGDGNITQPPAPITKNTVNIEGFAFSPSPLTVKVGTLVTWTNYDESNHTVTSDSGSLLNSPQISLGKSFTFTFTQPGTYTYHCALHPNMKGTVVVTQ